LEIQEVKNAFDAYKTMDHPVPAERGDIRKLDPIII